MEAWLNALAARALALGPVGLRAGIRARAAHLVAPAMQDKGGAWTADYIRLRFKAVLQGPA